MGKMKSGSAKHSELLFVLSLNKEYLCGSIKAEILFTTNKLRKQND
jgi:hypothetical protein